MAIPILNSNPFIFPRTGPGINFLHPASQGLQFSGVARPQGGFVNLLTGGLGSITGTITGVVDSRIGPSSANSSGTSYISFANFPTTAWSQSTMACIMLLTAINGNTPQRIMDTAAAGSQSLGFDPTGTGASFGGTVGNTGFALFLAGATYIPYFFALSFFYNGASSLSAGVLKRLDTGSLLTNSVSTTLSAPTAGDGNLYLMNRGANSRQLDGYLAAAMFNNTFMPLPQLIKWSQNPWSFWYPNNLDLADMLSSAGLPPVSSVPVGILGLATSEW